MPITVTLDERVAVVTIDRQDALNALDVPTLTELRDRLAEIGSDDAVQAVVVTGAGERAFAAGADVAHMRGLSSEHAKAWSALGQETARVLETMPKPAIAAVNGYALGGGCELALACDLRYASTRARLGQPEVNLGIVPGWGGTQRLARLCGIGVAKDLIYTGRTVDAAEALRLGLVNGVADPVLDHALEVARALAAKSPAALRAAKRLVNSASDAFTAEVEEFGELFGGEDAQEGLAAFLEKRQPHFRDR
jgi:enoyl-CoA hydratase